MEQNFAPGLLNSFEMRVNGKDCRIRIFTGDLTRAEDSYDVAVCSAYKGDYAPYARTLIGALMKNRGISVKDLAARPEIDQRSQGCWLSSALEGPIGRIACVELLDWSMMMNIINSGMEDAGIPSRLQSSFLILRHLLETADDQGIMIRNIALPVLGAGDQGIETEYVAVPLFHQCRNMFSTIPSLCTIDFYELNPVRAEKLNRILLTLMPQENHPGKEVFISYSSKQTVRAHMLHDTLTRDGFSVWIAPEGIPAGNDYLDEIPAAISDANAVVMMMTLDSLSSYWVRREVTCAIDAGKFILPVQLVPFELTQKIRFMFDADQIMPVADLSEPEQDAMISGRLREKVRN